MKEELHEAKDHKYIPMTSILSKTGKEVRKDIYYYTNQIANIIFVGKPEDKQWFLIDAGLPGSAAEIRSVVEKRYGRGNKPTAIFLTHGHFDHVGALVELVRQWEIPVYAHSLEYPYLTGEQKYPEPDITVEGGMLAKLSAIYPTEPIQLGDYLKELPSDQSLPGLPEWQWFHTPGHSPGHVSFFRKHDKVLIAGDAFVTVRQDSFYKVLLQLAEVNGPPRYLTTNWDEAQTSVEMLANLNPSLAITGHGRAMEGTELSEGLERLVYHFEELAIPDYGKYVN